jgi:hypothetical protein
MNIRLAALSNGRAKMIWNATCSTKPMLSSRKGATRKRRKRSVAAILRQAYRSLACLDPATRSALRVVLKE